MPKLGLQIIHINLVPHTKFQLFFMSLRNIFGTTHFYDQMVFLTIRRHFCQRFFCITFFLVMVHVLHIHIWNLFLSLKEAKAREGALERFIRFFGALQ